MYNLCSIIGNSFLSILCLNSSSFLFSPLRTNMYKQKSKYTVKKVEKVERLISIYISLMYFNFLDILDIDF